MIDETRLDLIPYGWAPGGYYRAGACDNCGGNISGDKKCFRCIECAIKLKEKPMLKISDETCSDCSCSEPKKKICVCGNSKTEFCECGTEKNVYTIDVGDLPLDDVKIVIDKIKNEIISKRQNTNDIYDLISKIRREMTGDITHTYRGVKFDYVKEVLAYCYNQYGLNVIKFMEKSIDRILLSEKKEMGDFRVRLTISYNPGVNGVETNFFVQKTV